MAKHYSNLVIFGAFGDLAHRKLFPAIYQLCKNNLLAEDFRVLALARREVAVSDFRTEIVNALKIHVHPDELDDAVVRRTVDRIDYLRVNFVDAQDFNAVQPWIDMQTGSGTIFYLAIAASLYGDVCKGLALADCITDDSRVVVEKPVGFNLKSSCEINDLLSVYFHEHQIYRIDHYLGKETVQNLLALRFANSLFASQWDYNYISHVEITVAESVGIEGRWSYFDQAGQMRDMVQSHLLQLLCLIAMDPPNSLEADAIRDEKVKVLRALSWLPERNVGSQLIRGQYTAGQVNGQQVPGYLEEEGAVTESDTATFIAVKAMVDNWRWSGVPFYMRTGKRLPEKLTQIVVHYKQAAHFVFDSDQKHIAYNKLVIRIQPDEGISLQILTKEPGLDKGMRLKRAPLNIALSDVNTPFPDAYERLLWEVIKGDQYLFVRRDEVEAAWQWCDHLDELSRQSPSGTLSYAAGSWGPAEAIALMTKDGRTWYEDS